MSEDVPPSSPMVLRAFAVLSALWVLAVTGFQLFVMMFSIGMCHSGCAEAEAQRPLILVFGAAGIAFAVWVVAMAFRGRISPRMAIALGIVDLALPLLAYWYLRTQV